MARITKDSPAGMATLRPEGRGLRLRHHGVEGGIAPLQDGGWRWWLRDAANFFDGECEDRAQAEASLMAALHDLESGMRPNWWAALDRRPRPPRA